LSKKKIIINPVTAGQEIIFDAVSKEIRIYNISGKLIDFKKNIFDKYTVPYSLGLGIYVMIIQYNDGLVTNYKLVVK